MKPGGKKILLVVDHPKRDLGGLVYLMHKLITVYGLEPIITGTRNEVRSLILYRPDLILMSHLLFSERHPRLVSVAEGLGTRIGLLPTEGGWATETNQVGLALEELWAKIDLILHWGKINAQYLKDAGMFENAVIQACGCQRFDLHTDHTLLEWLDRKQFLEQNGLDPDKPVVFWAGSTPYANSESELDRVWQKRFKNRFLSFEAYRRWYFDNTMALNHSLEMIRRLARDVSQDASIIIKPHPAEKDSNYDVLRDNCPSIVFIPQSRPIESIIHYCDILLHFRCTTSIERWLIDITSPTIHMTHKDLTQPELKQQIFKGSDVVLDYDSLYERVNSYLKGNKVSEELIEYRDQFIEDYLYAADSKRAEHSAQLIDEFLKNSYRRRRFSKEFLIAVIAVYLRKIVGVNKGKHVREKTTVEYFDEAAVHGLMKRFNERFGTNVSETDYVVHV